MTSMGFVLASPVPRRLRGRYHHSAAVATTSVCRRLFGVSQYVGKLLAIDADANRMWMAVFQINGGVCRFVRELASLYWRCLAARLCRDGWRNAVVRE